MAYMSQERKAEVVAELKKVMPVGWKYSVSVLHHSTIVLTVSAAPVDLMKIAREYGKYEGSCGYVQVNTHWMHDHFKDSPVGEVFAKIQNVLYGHKDYYDRSDSMTDYFDTAYYVNMNIGKWNKPFVVIDAPKAAKVKEEPKEASAGGSSAEPFAKFMSKVLEPVVGLE